MKIEYHIDDMMTVFLEKMKCFAAQDQIIDLAEWFQLFSFDTIGCLTVSISTMINPATVGVWLML